MWERFGDALPRHRCALVGVGSLWPCTVLLTSVSSDETFDRTKVSPRSTKVCASLVAISKTVLPRLSSHERKADAERLRRSFEDPSNILRISNHKDAKVDRKHICDGVSTCLRFHTQLLSHRCLAHTDGPAGAGRCISDVKPWYFLILQCRTRNDTNDRILWCTVHPGEIDTNRLFWALCCFGFRLSAEPKMPGDHAANAPTLCFSGFVLRILSGLCHNCLQTEEAKLYIVYIVYVTLVQKIVSSWLC